MTTRRLVLLLAGLPLVLAAASCRSRSLEDRIEDRAERIEDRYEDALDD